MRAEIARLHRDLRTTTIHVTHDQSEAIALGDQIAILKDGALQQVGEAETLYKNPANAFVAAFLGSPPMNLLVGTLGRRGPDTILTLGDDVISLPEAVLRGRPGLSRFTHSLLWVGIRPEDLVLGYPSDGVRGRLRGEAILQSGIGPYVHVRHSAASCDPLGDEDAASLDGAGETVVVASTSFERPTPSGHLVELALDAVSLHFFDPVSGAAVTE
jgi:multiple sugar transport system ATP-binding protein